MFEGRRGQLIDPSPQMPVSTFLFGYEMSALLEIEITTIPGLV
jgi:hypothetical protein